MNPSVISSRHRGLALAKRGVKLPSAKPPNFSVRRLATPASSELLKTRLYDFHLRNEAKMVPFAGFSMPLLYGKTGQVASHTYVRDHVGLFDVGHMVQSFIEGPKATEFLQWLTPSSLASMAPFSSTLSVILNNEGGIIDDTVICKHSPSKYYVVTNAARKERDVEWITAKLEEWNKTHANDEPITFTPHYDLGLVALQGPDAAAYLQNLTSYDLSKLVFGTSAYMDIAGVNCHVARGGYTGEDGFEISIPAEHTESITQKLTQDPVQLIGLAARDSLRLEAGMCLYGHDLDETTSPVEAGLSWVIGKDRRAAGDFIGSPTVLEQLKSGVTRRRVGFVVEGPPAREGAEVIASDTQEKIGTITSGIPSPTLGKNIAMGYIKNGFHKKGTAVAVIVRGQPRNAVVTPMPFVQTRYWRGVAAK
ncbi:glycine cleavage system T protein [Clavulina sp. PMI_390]|nr:glycine cleavage system T protein [Clavulina sp. PMI_390]